jgi:hypothetical protein
MKVIDLLNKIANKEKLPKKIRIRGIYYRDYDKENDEMIDKEDMTIWELDNSYAYGDYYSKDGKRLFSNCYIVNRILNDEVEIIEEPQEHKISKKFEIYDNSIEWCCNGRSITDNEKDIMEKINEILKYLEEIK